MIPSKHIPVARFWSNVRKSRGCWLWIGTKTESGYGRIWSHGKTEMAHRISWRIHGGKIPSGKIACHRCDNPSCVNPRHIFIGTHQDNSDDMIRKGRDRAASGDENGTHTMPHRVARGDRHSSVTHPEMVPKGEAHGMRKLDDEKVSLIRRLFRRGAPQNNLAANFGVCKQTINNIVHRKNWKHLP